MVFALRHLAPVVALATSVVADFSLFYVTTEGLGLPGTEPDAATFFWFNNPPDCDDFGGVSSYLNQVDDYTGASIGAQCTDEDGSTECTVGDQPGKVQWNDDDNQVDHGQMLTCGLGDGAAISGNGQGSWDLLDSTGAIRGNCILPASPQQVDCPASEVGVNGAQVFQCTTDCTVIDSN